MSARPFSPDIVKALAGVAVFVLGVIVMGAADTYLRGETAAELGHTLAAPGALVNTLTALNLFFVILIHLRIWNPRLLTWRPLVSTLQKAGTVRRTMVLWAVHAGVSSLLAQFFAALVAFDFDFAMVFGRPSAWRTLGCILVPVIFFGLEILLLWAVPAYFFRRNPQFRDQAVSLRSWHDQT